MPHVLYIYCIVAYVITGLKVIKVWKCPTFALKFLWFDWRRPNCGERTMAEALAKISDSNFECIYVARIPSSEFIFVSYMSS